jgi:hypothetical protein
MEFRSALNVLIDNGHDKVGECPEGQVCSFAIMAEAQPVVAPSTPVVTLPSPAAAPSIPPIPPPNSLEPADGGATISVDKACYNVGETIVASFEGISGTGTLIGIFSADLVSDVQQLPSFDGADIKEWVLSCGAAECSSWLASGGAQLSTSNLEPGQFVAAISGPDGSNAGQASTNFQIGNC